MATSIVDKCKASIRGSEWREARSNHLLVEAFCQCCGRNNNLEVHHVIPWHIKPELRYESSNLITLCRECHFRFAHHSNWSDCNPSIREDCARFNQRFIVRAKRGWYSEEELIDS